MAYLEGQAIALKQSASLVPGNLAVMAGLEGEGSLTYAVVHKSCAEVVHQASAGVCTKEFVTFDGSPHTDKDPQSYLIQAKWCSLQSSKPVLVLTSYKGYKILEWNGSSSLHHQEIETPAGAFTWRFARGVVSVGDSVCIGTSEGDIVVLEVPSRSAEPKLTQHLQGHSAPVCALAANQQGEVASCDESGMIIVWVDPLSSPESSLVINEPGGVPCLSLCFWNGILIGGFANGLIKLYDACSGAKMVEIAAHARCINALDLAPEAGLLLSVSEDSSASIWKLPTDSNPKVSLVYSATVPNALLCGGRFSDPKGEQFALTAYETKELLIFTKL